MHELRLFRWALKFHNKKRQNKNTCFKHFMFQTRCTQWVSSLKTKRQIPWCIALQWVCIRSRSSTAYLLRQTWLDESEESINVRWFERDTRPNVFHDLFTNSFGHKLYNISISDRKRYQTSLDVLLNALPCCLALDGTGMLLNSFTSLTLPGKETNRCLSRSCFSSLTSAYKNVTYKLSIMGVEVHGLCISLCRGMDFIRWYMGGHAIRACRV